MPLVLGRQFQFAPSSAAQLNRNHWALRGILGLAAGRKVWVGTTPGPVDKAAQPLTVTPYGAGWTQTSTNVELAVLPAQDDNSEFTLAWAGVLPTSSGSLVGHGQAGGGSPETLLEVNSNTLDLKYRNSALASVTMPTPVNVGAAGSPTPFLAFAVKQGLVVTLYVQTFRRDAGQALASATVTAASGDLTISATQSIRYSHDPYGAGVVAASFSAAWSRALSLAEVRSLAGDLFQMFAR